MTRSNLFLWMLAAVSLLAGSSATQLLANDTVLPNQPDSPWWAFLPLAHSEVPVNSDDHWSQTAIDRFVMRTLRTHELTAAPEANRAVLIRRLYFDLLGVPPTPEEIQAFLDDTSENAWERLVDRLLADVRYGEHWARFWLDLVRYAESDGWNQDAYRPHLWRYRDYVIRSLNQDRPWPRFVSEQLAGDELSPDDPDSLAATGFLRLGIYEYNQRDARSHWNDILNETTDVTADVFLGMSVSCARCHDHKFDPIPQTDYFRLKAFFEPLVWRDDIPGASTAEQQEHELRMEPWNKATLDVRTRIQALLKPYHDRKWFQTVDKFPADIQDCFRKAASERSSLDEQLSYFVTRQFEEEGGGPLKLLSKEDKLLYDALQAELATFDSLKPDPLPALMTVRDFPGTIAPTPVQDAAPGTVAEPGFLTALSSLRGAEPPQIQPMGNSTGRRSALAAWIVRPDNPLTTRVIVNRIWQQHFGTGLVATASDFGQTGEHPVHPKLLDWLTQSFIDQGWSFKSLHRLILTSAVWKQSCHHPDAVRQQQVDPAERLLWRAAVRRLKAEQVRDAMLAVSGELSSEVGGPSVVPEVPRRAIYVKVFRNVPDELYQAFDGANGLQSTCDRSVTTTPTQSLYLLNSEFTLTRAAALAAKIRPLMTENTAEGLNQLCLTVLGRRADSEEVRLMTEFLQPPDSEVSVGSASGAGATRDRVSLGKADTPAVDDDLVDLCHVLLNSSEFLYLD